MAGPTQLDMGQLLTYLYLYTLPYIIHYLLQNPLPSNPAEIKQTIWVCSQVPPWPPRGHRGHMSRYKYRQKVRPCRRGRVKWKAMLWAHLFALAIAYFRVGCCVELHLHCIFGAPLCLTAFMSSAGTQTKSASTPTLFLYVSTTMHPIAWPTPLTSLKT
jgi:hypothetical protein